MKSKTKMILWSVIVIIMIIAISCIIYNIIAAKTHEIKNPIVTFEIENYGNIKIELYPEYAPNTVLNFIHLINKGYYDGKTFYGKDINAIYAAKTVDGEISNPTMSLIYSDIAAGSELDLEYQIDGEFIANGFDNTLKHEKGVVSMLREEYSSYFGLTEKGYNSASSGFQIMLDTNRNLNGLYSAFGKVIEGLDIVEAIFNSEEVEKEDEAETTAEAVTNLLTPAVIKKASVETFGINYGIPKVHQAFDYEAFLQEYFSTYSN